MNRCACCGARCCAIGGVAAPPGSPDEQPPIDAELSLLPRAGFRARRVLGVGGFGAVIEAAPEPFGESVAIKVARNERPLAKARLLREADALAAIGPPHVPAMRGLLWIDGDTPLLVMDLVSAPTLAARLAERPGPIALPAVRSIAASIARAVGAAHARGFAHCDLKPENILAGDGAPACLVDFGLARRIGEADAELASEGTILGTPEYMAPEQCLGRADVDHRADVYALGVMLFEMLTGRAPFWGSAADVQKSHRSRRPPRPSEVTALPAELDDVVLRCLAKEPGDRFQSVAELAEALESTFQRTRSAVRSPATAEPHEAEPPANVKLERERRTIAVLFFTTEAELSRVQAVLAPLGGQLAHAGGAQMVAAFDHDAGENPVRLAAAAARGLIAGGLAARALVDLIPVSVQRKASGVRRYQSPLFASAERYPGPRDPAALLVTRAAAELLGDQRWIDVPGRPEIVEPEAAPSAVEEIDRTPLLGRDEMLDRLASAAHAAVAGRYRDGAASGPKPRPGGAGPCHDGAASGPKPRAGPCPTAVTVLAEPGHGKSRFARALHDRLRQELPEAAILALRAREPADGSADATLHDLLRFALDLPAIAPPDGGRALLEARLGGEQGPRLWPGVAIGLSWADPDVSEVHRLRAAPGALRAAAAHAAGEALRRRARQGPLIVLLDDAHLADEVTLDALEHAAHAEAGLPLFACALARPTFQSARPEWGKRAGSREEVWLGPLPAEAAAALCRALLAPVLDVPARAVELLVQRAQAIPLALIELVRCLKREGAVRRHGRGDGWYLAADEIERTPDLPLLEWIAQREIEALSPDLAAHARLASLLGAEVSPADIEGVVRVLEQKGEARELRLDARVGVRQLLAAGLLVTRPQGRVGFRHALVREAVARAVPPAQRVRLHRAAFEHYRDAHGARSEGHLAQLAHHAAEAGLADAARNAYFALAERARERHAYLDAGALYTRALEQPGEAPRAFRGHAHRGRGLMHYRIGRYEDALRDLDRARTIERERGETETEVEILLDEATVLDWMESFRAAEARVEEARALADGLRSSQIRARLLLGLGRARHRACREVEACDLLFQAAAAAEKLGPDGYETRVISLLVLGFILPGLGRLEEAERVLAQTIADTTAHGDRLHLYAALNNRALAWGYRGDKAQMVATFERALSLALELGQTTMEFVAHYNLAEYLYLMDDLPGARPHVEQAAAIERRMAGDAARPVVALLRARLRFHGGEVDQARAAAAAIRAGQASARDEGRTETLMMPAEEVLLGAIELGARDAGDAEWQELEERSRSVSIGQERIEVIEFRALASQRGGRLVEARGHFERALALAATIPNVMGDRLRAELAAVG